MVASRDLSRRQRIGFWLIAGLAVLGLGYAAQQIVQAGQIRGWHLMTAAMPALFALAAWAVRQPTTGWQVVGRAVVVGVLLQDMLLALSMSEIFGARALQSLAVATVILAVLGKDGLGPDDGPFQPRKFRRTLLLAVGTATALAVMSAGSSVSMILARLDAPYGWDTAQALRMFAPAVVYGGTAYLLYRMKAIALVFPLVWAGWLAVEALVLDDWAQGRLLTQVAYLTLVLVPAVPFLGQLLWLRIRGRGNRQHGG